MGGVFLFFVLLGGGGGVCWVWGGGGGGGVGMSDWRCSDWTFDDFGHLKREEREGGVRL